MGLKYLYLAYLSKPASERKLYRTIKREQVTSILEIGVGEGQRALRMIDLARRLHPEETIRYSGIDLFEARNDGEGVAIKEMHRLLSPTGAKFRLIPGDPFSALSRKANDLPKAELVVISSTVDKQSLAKAWFYLPRLLEKHSLVMREEIDEELRVDFDELDRAEVERLAAKANGRKAA
ncbi:MAG: hypothetical protein K1X74_16265 [Pirellulales bacterium]|nr:hypothetical protein [Pirellulales bacterium]